MIAYRTNLQGARVKMPATSVARNGRTRLGRGRKEGGGERFWGEASVGGLGIKCRFNGFSVFIWSSLSVCVCVDGDREEVERHLRADYSVLITGGRRGFVSSTLTYRWMAGCCSARCSMSLANPIKFECYHPRMRHGNVFSRVCLSVML